MGPVFYVMAILGCGEADAACQPVSVAPARYESFEACTAKTDDALLSADDTLFPVVVAQCRRSDDVEQDLTLDRVDLPEPASGKATVQRASLKRTTPSRG